MAEDPNMVYDDAEGAWVPRGSTQPKDTGLRAVLGEAKGIRPQTPEMMTPANPDEAYIADFLTKEPISRRNIPLYKGLLGKKPQGIRDSVWGEVWNKLEKEGKIRFSRYL